MTNSSAANVANVPVATSAGGLAPDSDPDHDHDHDGAGSANNGAFEQWPRTKLSNTESPSRRYTHSTRSPNRPQAAAVKSPPKRIAFI